MSLTAAKANVPRNPVLVTGAFGMLGSYFQGERFFRTGRKELDVRELSNIRRLFTQKNFSLILHLAALTNLDYCEKHPDEAAETNVFGTENMARMAHEFNIPIVYVSTAGIFSGNPKEVYAEDDIPSPVSLYAQTKFGGEKAIESLAPRSLIFRVGWLMGGVERDHKFVGTLLRRLLLTHGKPQRIEVVNDTRGSLLYAKDFAQTIWTLIRDPKNLDGRKLFHIGNAGTCTRWEIAQAIKDFVDERTTHQKSEVELISVPSNRYEKSARMIPRPKSEVLMSKHLEDSLNPPLRHWRHALEDYLNEWTSRN